MKFTIIGLVLGLAVSVSTTPLTNDILPRAVTPDNTCGNVAGGNNKGYTCDPKLAQGGPCCSQSGYCGSTDAYCGAGCQSAFGTCSKASSTSTTTSAPPTSSTPVGSSTDTCGGKTGEICAAGYCCSKNGYCGTSDDYCGAGCQKAFGGCGDKPTSSAPSGPGPTGSTDLCGPTNGNAVCAKGLCCSPEGYCGKGEEYCADPDCQYNFGTCDSDTTPAGVSTINDPRPLLGKVTYKNDIYDCTQANVVALTYDDGPGQYTSELLDVLKQYGFKATFFMTGNNIGKGPIDVTAPYPSVIKRMIAEGHQVASHTWSHYDLSKLTSSQRIQQMVKNERAIANIIGKYPTYMRPPYSSCDEDSGCWADLLKLGYHRTYFDLDTQDYLNDDKNLIQKSKNIVKWALGNATQGTDFLSIQHDIHQQSVANLSSYYFDLIKKKGWKGVSVGTCLGDPEENWYRTPGNKAVSSSTTKSSTPTTIKTSTKTSATTGTKTTTKANIAEPTSAQSTSAPQPTAQCDQPKSGNFCGKVRSFDSRAGCYMSDIDCKNQGKRCSQEGGTKAACADWASECSTLKTYCDRCGRNCSVKGFRASQE